MIKKSLLLSLLIFSNGMMWGSYRNHKQLESVNREKPVRLDALICSHCCTFACICGIYVCSCAIVEAGNESYSSMLLKCMNPAKMK